METEILRINEDGEVEITNEGVELIEVVKVLKSLNYNKQQGDHDGRKRLRLKNELKYVFLVHHPRSPYREYSDSEKDIEAKLEIGLPSDWVMSTELKLFITKFRDYTYTRLMKLLDAAEKAIDKVRDYLEKVDFSERTGTGNVVNHPTDIMKLIADMPKVASGLRELQQQAKTQMVGARSKSRGDHETGWIMEEKQAEHL